jgi:aminopeptidase N
MRGATMREYTQAVRKGAMNVTGRQFVRAFLAPSVVTAALWGATTAAAQQATGMAPPSALEPRVEHYEFALDLPAQGKHIVGGARLTFAAPLGADTVRLDLDGAMRVSSAWVGCADDRRAAAFEHAGALLKVAVPSGAAEARCLALVYDGEPADGLIITTDSAGRWAAFGDNFPNRARFWLPTQDHPSRKASVTFIVTAPAGRSVVANGALVGAVTNPDSRVTTTWRTTRPIPTYGMVIAAAPLTAFSLGETACGFAEDGGCVPQMAWTAPEQAVWMPGHFESAGRIVEFYARTIGAYPYEKLGHLQTTTRYGGMENPSAIFYYDRGFRRRDGIAEDLIAHETAHQWFGNAVTEREWAHIWLSEGFATFFAALWAQHAHGDSAYMAEMASMRSAVLRAEVVTRRSVIDSVETDPNRLLNENSYPKGGFVLRMLRDEVGDSAFFAGLRRYYTAHHHGNALTADLQAAIEASAGRTLGWFFDQWLRKPGWAELRTSFSWDPATARVTLRVEQGTRFGPYRLTLPVELVDASGVVHRERLVIEAVTSQSVTVPGTYASAPTAVRCDPNFTLLALCTAK